MLQSTKESQRNQMIQKYKFIKHFWTSKPVEWSKLSDKKRDLNRKKNAQVQTKYHHVYYIKKRQKLLEFYRAGLSERDVIRKNITGLNKRTVYRHFQKLKQTGTSLRKSGSRRRCKLTNMHKQMIFEIIKSDHFLTVKEIAERASSNLPEVDRISPTTVWRFIRSMFFFWVNCL